MFNKKNHIGRPSNHELKVRRNKKIALISIPFILVILLVILFSSGSLKSIMGDSVTNFYCEDSEYQLNGDKCEKIIEENPILLGDLNNDDKITEDDLNILRKYVDLTYSDKNYEFTEEQIIRSDIDKDGIITETDYSILIKYLKNDYSSYDTNSSYYYNIGKQRKCKSGYNLQNNLCIKKIVIDAKKQVTVSDKEKKYFTINYNANGGVGSMNSQNIIYGTETKLTKNAFKKNTDKFVGWKILNNTRTEKTGNEYWACFKNKEKTDRGYATKDICEKYGYQIYNDEQVVSQTASIGEVITMYATWEGNNYFTINYNANGGVGSMNSQNIIYGTETKLTKNAFKKNTDKFVGWKILNNTRTEKTGNEYWACFKNKEKTDRGYATKDICEKYGYQIYNDEQVVSQTANIGEVITMYATWEGNNYFTINYNANGGIGSMNSQNIIYGTETKLTKNAFKKNNSKFAGWRIYNNTRKMWACFKNKEKTDKGYATKDICEKYGYQVYNDEQVVSQTANIGEVITMYAQWKEGNYFTVKYNANGGIGVMPDQRIEFGIETKLNPNKFTSNKAFAGFRVYNNTRKKWACYKNTNKSDQGYVTNDYCNKYGYVIYDDNQVVSKTANPGEIVTMYAQWKEGNYFTVKYNANGGTGVMSNQNVEYGKKTKLLRNTFTNNGKLIRGWKIYNNSTNLWACYKNANKTDYGYATKDVCEKYGYQIYDNMQTISKTANKGEVITMYASWIDLKKYFDVPAVEEFATLELSTKGLYRQKVIQDIYVNNSDIYVSQDNFGKNPSISKDSTPSELIITKISRKNHSMQEIFREKKCGHGFFTIPSGVLMTTCDVDTPYDKDAHGHKAYKITSKGKREFLADAFQNKRESFKIDYNNGIYMARINDGTQRFKFYKYNKDSKTVGSYIRTLNIKDTPYDMQGYALDGNYLYIYYGEGIDSGSNRLKYSVAYIDVYNANTGKLIKKNRIFRSNDTYMEAEGLDYLGDSIYIGVATTDEYDSAYGDIKYANVYRIKKKDLIN